MIKRICKYCGVQFEVPYSKIKCGYGIYCSNKCKYIDFGKSHTGENSTFYGKYHSKEAKQKIGDAHRGKIPWNKGVPRSLETILKISKSKKGKTCSSSTKFIKNDPRLVGQVRGEGYRRKLSLALTGIKKTKQHIAKLHQNQKGFFTGEKNPNWKNGVSKYPYPFNFDNSLKNLIRQRDNYICRLCGKIKESDDRQLSVHHIDYNKDNLQPSNLITLCRKCNGKVNYNRNYWTKFLQSKFVVHNRYFKEQA